MNTTLLRITFLFLFPVLGLFCPAQSGPQITVDAGRTGSAISPTMYGVFFEDINFAADGGLYAELVKNRSFEFDHPLTGWQVMKKPSTKANLLILRDETRERNPRYIRLQLEEGQPFRLHNDGFRGMGIRNGATYRFALQARVIHDDLFTLRIELVDENKNVLAEAQMSNISQEWQTYQCEMQASETAEKGGLNIWIKGQGTLDLDMVSLFPKDTWKGRKNGLRADLVQLLAELQPGFLRFPGGCIVEGFDLSQRYQWKHTIGEPSERILNINRWNFEFKHRLTLDYFQSYGLGFYEFFLLAEDIGAEPMPILNCGMACQFNTAELVSMDDLDPYVQDALDLIEFANGPADSYWGGIRAEMGHPEPFQMNMLGIGNEQWGPQYIERYTVFAAAIQENYPDIQLIAAAGSDATIFPNGQEEIDYLWSQWRNLEPDFVDEHFYRRPEWFLENVDWYDDYNRQGPKVFVGEWASQSVGVASPDNRNTWETALYEAAFMIGLERNADLVRMTCYAPLFAHEEAWQWRPDLIWFDNLRSYGTANYYVQKLFSVNAGTHLLPLQLFDDSHQNEEAKHLFAGAVFDENTGDIIIKVVNATNQSHVVQFELENVEVKETGLVYLLTSESLDDENTLQEPDKIVPQENSIKPESSEFSHEIQPLSLTVLRIPATKR